MSQRIATASNLPVSKRKTFLFLRLVLLHPLDAASLLLVWCHSIFANPSTFKGRGGGLNPIVFRATAALEEQAAQRKKERGFLRRRRRLGCAERARPLITHRSAKISPPKRNYLCTDGERDGQEPNATSHRSASCLRQFRFLLQSLNPPSVAITMTQLLAPKDGSSSPSFQLRVWPAIKIFSHVLLSITTCWRRHMGCFFITKEKYKRDCRKKKKKIGQKSHRSAHRKKAALLADCPDRIQSPSSKVLQKYIDRSIKALLLLSHFLLGRVTRAQLPGNNAHHLRTNEIVLLFLYIKQK